MPRRKYSSARKILKEAVLTQQDYYRMKKKKLIEIAKAKGISGANKKKKKSELVAKLCEVS